MDYAQKHMPDTIISIFKNAVFEEVVKQMQLEVKEMVGIAFRNLNEDEWD